MYLKDMNIFTALTRNMEWLAARQRVLSENIANADTPGYRAKDLEKLNFRDLVSRSADRVKADTTHPGHIRLTNATTDRFTPEQSQATDKTPNENNVALEDEILKVNDARQAYDLAASLYRKHVQMLKMAVGGRGGG